MSLAMTIVAAVLVALLVIFGAVRLSMWRADRKVSNLSSSWSDHSGDAWDGSTAHGDGDGGGGD